MLKLRLKRLTCFCCPSSAILIFASMMEISNNLIKPQNITRISDQKLENKTN